VYEGRQTDVMNLTGKVSEMHMSVRSAKLCT
jgi:hypothetical protein